MAGPDLGLAGKWKLESSSKFDEYMGAVGVGMVMRKMAAMAKPEIFIKVDGTKWYIKSVTTFKTSEVTFTIGEEFDEETPDGRNVKSKVTIEGKTLVHKQSGATPSTITRELQDGFMVMSLTAKDVVCNRKYTRAD